MDYNSRVIRPRWGSGPGNVHRNVGGASTFPNIHIRPHTASVFNLPAKLTINNITVEPEFMWYGRDGTATGSILHYNADTLTTFGTGAAPTTGLLTPFPGTADDVAVGFPDTAKSYISNGTTVGDVDQEDFVIECVFRQKLTTAGYEVISKKRDDAGWQLWTYGLGANSSVVMYVKDADANSNSTVSATTSIPNGAWGHILVIYEYGVGCSLYLNAINTPAGADDVSAVNASLTNSANLRIGGDAPDGNTLDGEIAYLAMWKRDDWMSGSQQADLATERMMRLCGLWDEAGGTVPTWARNQRGSAIYKGNSSTHKVFDLGKNLPALYHRSNGDVVTDMYDAAITNHAFRSHIIDDWQKTNCTVETTNLAVSPDGWATAQGIIPNLGDPVTCDVRHAFGSFSHGQVITSCWAKAGNYDWILMRNYFGTSGRSITCYFDVKNGAIGTYTAGCDPQIEAWPNGWFRISMKTMYQVGDSNITEYYYPAEADGDAALAGDGATVATWIWGCSWAQSADRHPVYFKADTDTGVRTADSLYYAPANEVMQDHQGTLNLTFSSDNKPSREERRLAASQWGALTNNTCRITLASGNQIRVITDGSNQGYLPSQTILNKNIVDGHRHTVHAVFDKEEVTTAVVSNSGVITQANTDTPLIELDFAGRLDNLSTDITLEGVTVSPYFRYLAENATASTWTAEVGADLVEGGAGDAPTAARPTPLPNNTDEAIKYNVGKFHEASATSDNNDLTTEDIVFECVFQSGSLATTEEYMVSKYNGAGNGWYFYKSSSWSTRVLFRILQGAGDDNCQTDADDIGVELTGITTDGHRGTWNHVLVIINRDGDGQIYLNGQKTGSAGAFASTAGSIANSTKFSIGGISGSEFSGSIAYCAMWKRDNWVNDGDEYSDFAAQRFRQLIGFEPLRGSADTITLGRSCISYTDRYCADGVRRLFPMGWYWPPVQSILDTNGDLRTMTYLQADSRSTNHVYTESMGSVTQTNCSIVEYAVENPIGVMMSQALEGSGGDAQHRVTKVNGAANSSGSQYIQRAWIKPGNLEWVAIRWYDGTSSPFSYFNLTGDGVLGTMGAGTEGRIESWGNGWYLCEIRFTPLANNTVQLYIYGSDGDGDTSYTPAGGPDFYVWGWGAEDGAEFGDHYIQTGAAGTYTRNADIVRYETNKSWVGLRNDVGMGRMELTTHNPDIDVGVVREFLKLTWNGREDNRIRIVCQTDEFLDAESVKTGGNSGTTGIGVDVWDDDFHTAKAYFSSNYLRLDVDGSLSGPDFAVDPPPVLNRLDLDSRVGNVRLLGSNDGFIAPIDMTRLYVQNAGIYSLKAYMKPVFNY